MPIAFITLKMVFVLAGTTGDTSNLSCQRLSHQVHFVYNSMSSGIVTQSRFNSIIRCGTTEKVATEQPPWSFGFMPLPFLALRSGASFILCLYGVILETEWKLRLLKSKTGFKCGPTKV
jgi:hypothetical protein